MQEKILTISVAAYNVEKYIDKNLKSIINSGVIDKIEIFVIDDGGSDGTLKIARSFEKMYPNSIHAIHKENGGYGSTVNYSIEHATGKYIKLLDGDDWVYSAGLAELVAYLERSDIDAVVTNYCVGSNEGKMKLINYYDVEGGKVKKISSFKPKMQIGMWSLTLKTEVIKESDIVLPENCLYTDQFVTVIPFACVESLKYLNTCVYCYRTDRNGQSTGRVERVKHVDEAVRHCFYFAEFYEKKKTEGCENCGFICQRAAALHKGSVKTMLLMPINGNNLKKIREHERKMKLISSDIYKEAAKKTKMGRILKLLRTTNYMVYWILKLIPGGVPNWQ